MQNLKPIDPEPLHALTHALRAWVLTAAALLAEVFEPTLSRDLRILVRKALRATFAHLRLLLVALALAHMDIPFSPPRTTRPLSHPRGFRRARHAIGVLRRSKRGLRLRPRSIRGRIAALRAVLARLKTWIARVMAHLERTSFIARLVAVAPPARVLAGQRAPACVGADTS